MKTMTPMTINKKEGKRMKAPVGLWLTWGGENDDVNGGSSMALGRRYRRRCHGDQRWGTARSGEGQSPDP
ncbi:hypothetical protein E2562_001177 [Oryza meyeriana var. granulata]|uniref:Uncharacterized protein n=1 Tax=Oryza meyeriana var. granulata TaxID=110450 RepID=A0A6G1DDW2_9ORYZ|nr:hypothetical protein E2562_001177 [Oryza meyeriana var. granulata]